MSPPKVLVVGDYMVDRYWVGEATRVSPEAPIPVITIKEKFDRPGGAGNVRANLDTLGVKADLMCFGWDVIIKNRLMVGDTQMARWDEERQYPPVRFNLKAPLKYDAIVVADYLKGSIDNQTIIELGEFNLPTFVDTKGDPTPYLVNFRDVTVFPNLKEYSQRKNIYNQFKTCILKKGSHGMVHLHYGKELRHELPKARFVRSVNGAGDTVVAAYVAAMLLGYNDALGFASKCAAEVVEQSYTATPQSVQYWNLDYVAA